MKKDWRELEDEDEERLEAHTKQEEIIRVRPKPNDAKANIEETVSRKVWCIPVRKQVLERKKWAKFGVVQNVQRGEHKQGDWALEAPVEIQTSGDQGEIGIVEQLKKMNTEQVKEKRELAKLEQEEVKNDKMPETKGDKWNTMLKAGTGNVEYVIKVSNIVSYEKDPNGNLNVYYMLRETFIT